MNRDDSATELNGEEKGLLASMPRTMAGDDLVEDRTVAALHAKSLLRAGRGGRAGKPLRILSAFAAATVLFVAGDGYGKIRSALAQRPDTVIRMAGAPRYAGVSTMVEELSIGVVTGADEYTFGRIYDIAVAQDGSIYVYDLTVGLLRRYDSSGKYLNSFVRRGQGPGEATNASGMGVLPNGNVAFYDSQQKRINIYTAAGEYIRQLRLDEGGGVIGHRRGLVADTAGFVYAKRTLLVVPTQTRGGQAPFADSRDMWLRVRPTDGSVVDTLLAPEWPAPIEPFRVRVGNSMRQMAMPFLPSRVMTISPLGYAVTGYSNKYAFEMLVSPRRVISVRRNVPVAAVSTEEYNAARSRIENGMREVDPSWSWNGRDILRVKPFYSGIDIGLDGRIWLIREITPLPQVRSPSTGRGGGAASAGPLPGETFVAKPTLFDVFEPSGVFIGSVQSPPMVTPMVMRGDYVWGTYRDENDVEFVKRYRIVWR